MRGPYLIGAGVILAVAAGALWYALQPGDTVAPATEPEVQATPESTGDAAAPEIAEPQAPEADAGEPAVEESEAVSQELSYEVRPRSPGDDSAADTGTQAPSFDIVRINPRGDSVIAGRAAPGAEVVVRDDGEVIGRTKADTRGEWVMVPERPLAPGTRELDLLETLPESGEEVQSDDVVILVVPEPEEGDSDVQVAQGDAKSAQEQPLAVLVPRDEPDGGQILQRSAKPDGVSEGPLSLEIIEYDEKGSVNLSGRAREGDEVRVYLDNELVDVATPDEEGDGAWKATPGDDVSEGEHVLRLDLVDAEGSVIARLETPFARAVAPQHLPEDQRYVVIQPGDYLWKIARRTYGRGIRYLTIFEANREQIRDPDLIYPGQVFVLPEGEKGER